MVGTGSSIISINSMKNMHIQYTHTQADLVREIYGAHGGYETAEVRDVRRTGGGHGLCGGPGKKVGGVFPGRPQRFRH